MKKKKRHATLEEAERKAAHIGRLIDGQMPTGWGFFLCLTQFGGGGSMTYVSSCHRSSIPQFCRELAFKLEDKRDSLDVDPNYDPDMDKALELLSLFGTVLSGGMFQLNAVGDERFIEACGGREEFLKLVNEMQQALRSALKQAGDLVRRLKPELLDEEENVNFTEKLFENE